MQGFFLGGGGGMDTPLTNMDKYGQKLVRTFILYFICNQ